MCIRDSYRTGDITGRLGIVMEGSVNIVKDDVWGNRKIIENIGQDVYKRQDTEDRRVQCM